MRQIIDKWLIQRTTIDATIEHSVLRICEGVNENANSNSILLTFNLILNNRKLLPLPAAHETHTTRIRDDRPT